MKRSAAYVGIGTLLVAVVGYFTQLLAARWLGPTDYSQFAAFWSVLFLVVGCLLGISQEATRLARVAKLDEDAGRASEIQSSGPRLAAVAVGIGAAAAVVIVVTSPLWGFAALGPDWGPMVLLLAAGSLVTSAGLVAGGVLAGNANWRAYSILFTIEAVARLLLFVAAALFVPSVFAFSLMAVAAFLPGLAMAFFWRPLRTKLLTLRSEAAATVTRILRAMAATGLSGILVTGFPVLLTGVAAVHPRGITPDALGILVLLVVLTRAPLMVPLTTFQNVFIARFTSIGRDERRGWVLKGSGAVLAASAVLAGLAALLGPPLLPFFFGPEFTAGAGIIAALTAAAAALGLITLTGLAALASGRHSAYLAGWGIATTISVGLLAFLPVPLEWAVVAALVVGPVLGCAVHVVALLKEDVEPTRVTEESSAD